MDTRFRAKRKDPEPVLPSLSQVNQEELSLWMYTGFFFKYMNEFLRGGRPEIKISEIDHTEIKAWVIVLINYAQAPAYQTPFIGYAKLRYANTTIAKDSVGYGLSPEMPPVMLSNLIGEWLRSRDKQKDIYGICANACFFLQSAFFSDLGKIADHNFTAWRGVRSPPIEANSPSYLCSTSRQFTSATKRPHVAISFVGSYDCCLFKCMISEGIRYIDVVELAKERRVVSDSWQWAEDELIFPLGTRMCLTDSHDTAAYSVEFDQSNTWKYSIADIKRIHHQRAGWVGMLEPISPKPLLNLVTTKGRIAAIARNENIPEMKLMLNKDLIDPFLNALKTNTNLKILKVEVDSHHAPHVAKAVLENRYLNMFGDLPIAQLRENKLTNLQFSDLSNVEAIVLTELLKDSSVTGLHIEYAYARDCQALVESIKENRTLTNLSLTNIINIDELFLYIASVLEVNKYLTTVRLVDNGGRTGWDFIMKAIAHNKAVTTLDLSSNNRPFVLFNIAQALQNNATLTSLILKDNNIERGVKELNTALIVNKTLTYIDISDNKINIDKQKEALESIGRSRTLIFLPQNQSYSWAQLPDSDSESDSDT